MASSATTFERVHRMIEAAFKALDLAPEYAPEYEQYRAVLPTEPVEPARGCSVRLDRETETVVATAFIAGRVPEEQLPAVVEFVTRVNYALPYGSLDVDVEEGAVQARTGLCFAGTEPDEMLVRTVLKEAVDLFTHFLPSLTAVANGTCDAYDAYVAAWDE